MYTCYQVVIIAEDGRYVDSEWQTENAAIDAADRLDLGEGQRVVVVEVTRTF